MYVRPSQTAATAAGSPQIPFACLFPFFFFFFVFPLLPVHDHACLGGDCDSFFWFPFSGRIRLGNLLVPTFHDRPHHHRRHPPCRNESRRNEQAWCGELCPATSTTPPRSLRRAHTQAQPADSDLASASPCPAVWSRVQHSHGAVSSAVVVLCSAQSWCCAQRSHGHLIRRGNETHARPAEWVGHVWRSGVVAWSCVAETG